MKTIFLRFYPIVFLSAFVTFVLPICTYAQTLKSDWTGNYEFFDAERGGPKNQPNNFVTYTLIVSQDGEQLTARFTADGTQISDDYECRVEMVADSMKVFFVKDLGGMEQGKAQPLKNDDLIFTLIKTTAPGKKTRYLFRKGKYEIFPLSAISQNKIYFDKKK